MSAAVLDQPPLFAGAGSHAVTVERVEVRYIIEQAGTVIPRSAEWFRWLCSCGRSSGQSMASHWNLALRTGEGHVHNEVAR